MTERLFAEGWTVEDLDLGVTARVRLPHDAMIGRRRSADAPTGYHGAYFPGGRYRYVKRWEVPDGEDRRHRLRFEGIGGAATISLNGIELAAVSSRYRDVLIDADSAVHAGEPNELVVEVDDSAKPDSRWYTGSGLYRPVWLDETGPVRFANDGVRIVTEEAASDAATLRVTTFTDGEAGNAAVRVSVRDGSRTVAEASGAPGELALTIAEPRLWSADSPHTYVVEVALLTGGQVSDSRTVRTGIRTVSVDARRGLRVNGREVLLRGACIHHDSGVLGAATHRAFEYRRARILKQNGYNAVRSSHNPLSRDMLDACDEVGLYVMDELTDTWFNPKTAHDASSRFEDTWPDDLAAMIATDRNHPSVIIYSIGNEIAETATPAGVNAARRLADAARRLDPTRPTTLAVNFLLNVLASRGKSVFSTQEEETDENKSEKKPNAVTSTIANVIADKLGSISQLVSRLPAADKASRDAFETVDVAGYNYAWSRYRGDARRHPDRVVCGTESMPGDIVRIWPLVEELPNVIGDFMWTGWDYLGETGLGTWSYGKESVPLTKPYPQITAGTGAIDITGLPGVPTLLARAVWGQLNAPGIAVRPLDVSGEKVRRSAWRSSDAVSSWAWRGAEGTLAEIEVYSADDEVELLVNGRSLGRRRAGARGGYIARFRTPYAAGELTAVGYRAGRETARSTLRSAGEAVLVLDPERVELEADGNDLAFVHVELRDGEGTVEMLEDDRVRLDVDGPAELIGFGSGASANAESYNGDTHRTSYGRALAVLRSTGKAGTVTLRAVSDRHGQTTVELTAVAPVVSAVRS